MYVNIHKINHILGQIENIKKFHKIEIAQIIYSYAVKFELHHYMLDICSEILHCIPYVHRIIMGQFKNK